jgi:hypothetical protein
LGWQGFLQGDQFELDESSAWEDAEGQEEEEASIAGRLDLEARSLSIDEVDLQACLNCGRTLVCCQKEKEEGVVGAFEHLEVVQVGVERTWAVVEVGHPFWEACDGVRMGEGVAVDDVEVVDQHLDAQAGQEQRVSTTFVRCWWVVGAVVVVE